MKVGELIYDYALGMSGIVVDGPWTEVGVGIDTIERDIDWEWNVLYEDGELQGADTNDLEVISESW